MAYLGDPRENAIDVENGVIWEQDNRIEQRWKWNGVNLDLCDMSVDEYMKNPIVDAIEKSGGQGSETEIDAINNAADRIVDAISGASETTNENIDESTTDIIDAIYSAATIIGSTVQSSSTLEILFYYASVNSQVNPNTLTSSDFASDIVVIGSDTYINFLLGDPTPENWNKFINGQITEQELRNLSSNSYYIAIPKAFKGKLTVLENGTADVTNNFIEIPSDIFSDYIMYQSVDDDYFNEDYEEGITNVKQPHKITIAK